MRAIRSFHRRHVAGHGRAGPARARRAGAARGLGRRRHGDGCCDGSDLRGRSPARAVPPDRVRAGDDPSARHRRAVRTIRAPDCDWRPAHVLRDHRTERGHQHVRDGDVRDPQRPWLPAQRAEDLHLGCRRRRHDDGRRAHRTPRGCRRPTPGALDLRRRREERRPHLRPARHRHGDARPPVHGALRRRRGGGGSSRRR